MIYDPDFIEICIIDQEIIDDMLKFYSNKLQENNSERKIILEIIEQLKDNDKKTIDLHQDEFVSNTQPSHINIGQ